MKKYRKVEGAKAVCVCDRKNQKIQLEKVASGKNNDYYLIVESLAIKEKERSMNAICSTRFEEGLGRSEEILWDAYNTIREVESTIRCLKSDLDLDPIYHKKDESSLAHLNLGLLAYWIANTVRSQLKMNTLSAGEVNNADKLPEDNSIHDNWREIVRTMNTQKVITSTALNKNNEVVILRQCTIPNEKVKRIYDKLAYRQQPFKKNM